MVRFDPFLTSSGIDRYLRTADGGRLEIDVNRPAFVDVKRRSGRLWIRGSQPVVPPSAAMGGEGGTSRHCRERCASLQAEALAEIVVSSRPMNIEGEAQVKTASGEDCDRLAM